MRFAEHAQLQFAGGYLDAKAALDGVPQYMTAEETTALQAAMAACSLDGPACKLWHEHRRSNAGNCYVRNFRNTSYVSMSFGHKHKVNKVSGMWYSQCGTN